MVSTASHRVYILSLWTKAVFAVVEMALGLAIYFVTLSEVRGVTRWILHLRIFADPHDRRTVVMQYLLGGLPMNAKTFLAVYLLLHGALKIGLVAGLLSGQRWAHPVGLAGLGAFVIYQLEHYFTHGNPIILVMAAFDVFIMVMVWREWQQKMGRG